MGDGLGRGIRLIIFWQRSMRRLVDMTTKHEWWECHIYRSDWRSRREYLFMVTDPFLMVQEKEKRKNRNE